MTPAVKSSGRSVMDRAAAAEVKKYFTIDPSRKDDGHGKKLWVCSFCGVSIMSTATRLRAHLVHKKGGGSSGCKQVPKAVLEEIRRVTGLLQITAANANANAITKAAPPAVQDIENMEAWRRKGKDEVDEAVGAVFYVAGVPFSIAKTPEWTNMIQSVASFGPGYVSPDPRALKGPLLEKARESMEGEMRGWAKDAIPTTGFIFQSNGTRPLVNILLSTPQRLFFVGSRDTSGVEMDAEYLCGMWMDTIQEFGPENISAIVTDGDALNKAAAESIIAAYPHIFWVHSTSHALDVALEEIGALDLFKSTTEYVHVIVHFFQTHPAAAALLSPAVKAKLRRLSPTPTRFCTDFLSVKFVQEAKEELQRSVKERPFAEWAGSQGEELNADILHLCDVILSDDFWDKVDLHVALFKPIVELMRMVERDVPTMGKVHHHCTEFDTGIHQLSSVHFPDPLKDEIRALFKRTWAAMDSPLHAAAFAVDPEFQDVRKSSDIILGLITVCSAILTPAEATRAMLGHAAFQNKEGVFGKEVILNLAKEIPGWKWWDLYGGQWPELQKLAVRVLGMLSGAGACERDWVSLYLGACKKRGVLRGKRGDDLEYVFTNKKLGKRAKEMEGSGGWGEGEGEGEGGEGKGEGETEEEEEGGEEEVVEVEEGGGRVLAIEGVGVEAQAAEMMAIE